MCVCTCTYVYDPRVYTYNQCLLVLSHVVCIYMSSGLLIEMWKVTKVVEIKIDRENMIAGVFPRITFIDRPSYQSSTKQYDMVR